MSDVIVRKVLRVRPPEPQTHASKPTIKVTEPVNPHFESSSVGEVTLIPEHRFKVEENVNKNLEAFVERIQRKGSKEFQQVLEALHDVDMSHENGVLLTHQQVCHMFGVTSMTVYKWRNVHGLPTVSLPGGRCPPIRYDEGLVLAWAELMRKKVMNHDYKEWC